MEAAISQAQAIAVYPTCQAKHPDPRKHTQSCGAQLGATAGPVRFVAIRKRFAKDGRTWLHCPRCKAWNVFERAAAEPTPP